MPRRAEEIRVLLADDHYFIRFGIATAVAMHADMRVVAEATNGAQAIEMFALHAPDVTILDGSLPDMHGVEVTQRIRARRADARVLLFSVEEREENIYRAVHAGVSGYLPKSAAGSEVIDAIRTIASGGRVFPEEVRRKLHERETHVTPSTRELEVLRLLAEGLPNKIIADRLSVSTETVKTHVARILEKFGARDRMQAVMAAIERGLLRARK